MSSRAVTRSQTQSVRPMSTPTPAPTPIVKLSKYQMKKEQENAKKAEEHEARKKANAAKWLAERQEMFPQYKDRPICRFIRGLKESNNPHLRYVLFILGEISTFGSYGMWQRALFEASEKERAEERMALKALKVACPNLTISYSQNNPCEDRWMFVSWEAGEMDDVVFNDHIFPDYCMVDTCSLEY